MSNKEKRAADMAACCVGRVTDVLIWTDSYRAQWRKEAAREWRSLIDYNL